MPHLNQKKKCLGGRGRRAREGIWGNLKIHVQSWSLIHSPQIWPQQPIWSASNSPCFRVCNNVHYLKDWEWYLDRFLFVVLENFFPLQRIPTGYLLHTHSVLLCLGHAEVDSALEIWSYLSFFLANTSFNQRITNLFCICSLLPQCFHASFYERKRRVIRSPGVCFFHL